MRGCRSRPPCSSSRARARSRWRRRSRSAPAMGVLGRAGCYLKQPARRARSQPHRHRRLRQDRHADDGGAAARSTPRRPRRRRLARGSGGWPPSRCIRSAGRSPATRPGRRSIVERASRCDRRRACRGCVDGDARRHRHRPRSSRGDRRSARPRRGRDLGGVAGDGRRAGSDVWPRQRARRRSTPSRALRRRATRLWLLSGDHAPRRRRWARALRRPRALPISRRKTSWRSSATGRPRVAAC